MFLLSAIGFGLDYEYEVSEVRITDNAWVTCGVSSLKVFGIPIPIPI